MYSVRDSRPGAGQALEREVSVPKRLVPGPGRPPTPSPPPRGERPARTTWRWVTATSLGIAVLVSAWAFGPGGYVARTTVRDLTPVATVASVDGRADARLGAGATWAPLAPGDILRAGADVRTASAGGITLTTIDGVTLSVNALSRIDVPDESTVRFQFGSVTVDTRHAQADTPGTVVDLALAQIRLSGEAAIFSVARHARSVEVRVLDGRVFVNEGDALEAGACAAFPHRWAPGLEAYGRCR